MLANEKPTWPPIRSATAAPPPLYGTCTTSTPAIDLNSSPVRWVALPMPLEAKLSWPGRCFASAMSSIIDFTGIEGCTTSTCEDAPVSVTGAKSRWLS